MNIKTKILVVEDNNIERLALVKMLCMRFKKDNIFEASNGKEGLQLFKEYNPDIILTDIRMPIMDGAEMIEEIRTIDFKVPIIVVSAFEKELFRVEDLGISHYLLKPITILHLHNVIDSYLE